MAGLRGAVKALEARRAVLMTELERIDAILESLRSLDADPVRQRSARRKRGTWRPGRPGRPPRWYVEQIGSRRQSTVRAGKPKRRASAKQIAALTKARTALAVSRAATT